MGPSHFAAAAWLAVAAPCAAQAAAPAPTGAASPAPSNGGDRQSAQASDAQPDAESRASARDRRRRMFREPGGPRDQRKWMIGLEGVVFQSPPARPEALQLDPRFVGRNVALGGLGLFGRYRPSPFVGFDLGVRSGSVRYQDQDNDRQISQDQVMADIGTLVYLGRGEIAQFALSGGLGGMYNRIGYELESRDGTETFASGLVRVGGEAEFIVKRVAFVLSFRTYGVFTLDRPPRRRGDLFDSSPSTNRPPVAAFQTLLAGSAGIAYRF